MSEGQDENKNTSQNSFNRAARAWGTASGITASVIFGAVSMAMYSQSGSAWWIAGAVGGLLGAIVSGYETYRLSQEDFNQPSGEDKDAGDNRPAPKP